MNAKYPWQRIKRLSSLSKVEKVEDRGHDIIIRISGLQIKLNSQP